MRFIVTSILALATACSAQVLPAVNGGTAQSTWAKGDLLCSPVANTLSKLTVGADTTVLTADATSACGIKWSAAAVAPITIAAIAHKWLNSYTSGTGLFTQTQPACADLSDGAALCSSAGPLAVTDAGAANNFLTSYTSATGAFTHGRPTWANIDKATSSVADITTRTCSTLSDSGSLCTSSGPLPSTKAAVVSNFLTSYTSGTGAFTAAQPAFTDISGTATAAQVPTAGTVTTNANLTGPITSVGNATAINSQTGTGSTIVVSTGPTVSGLISNTLTFNTASSQITSNAVNGGIDLNSTVGGTGAVRINRLGGTGGFQVLQGNTATTNFQVTDAGVVTHVGTISPTAAGGTTVGTASFPYSSLYIGAAGTNNIRITGTATAARSLTLQDGSGTVPLLIASGTSTFTTTAVASGACQTTVTTAATNTLTSDVIDWAYTTAPVAATDGRLTIHDYVSANNVNFMRCNNTAASVTPTALVVNWRVIR